MINKEQHKPPFYIEKTLEYTVKGVEILRAETIQLFNDRNSYLSWGSAAITILFYSAATSNYNYPFLTYIMLLWVIPLVSCSLIIVSLDINRQIIKISRYLRSREKLINLLLELTLANDKSSNNFLKSPQLYHLRKQLPIYWEHQFYEPTLELKKNRQIKDIDWQCNLTTWIFTIVALTSYITGLCFKFAVQVKECKSIQNANAFFNDIYIFFNTNNKYYCNEDKTFFNWFNSLDFQSFIIFIISCVFVVYVFIPLIFWLISRTAKLISLVPNKVKNWLTFTINFTVLAIIVYLLIFYLPIVILIGIGVTFIYSNFWQIPKLTKIAQEPLSLDFKSILPDKFFPQEEENWSAIACVQMLLADRKIYEKDEVIPITQTLLAAMIGIPKDVYDLKEKLDKVFKLNNFGNLFQIIIETTFIKFSRYKKMLAKCPFIVNFGDDSFIVVYSDYRQAKIYNPKRPTEEIAIKKTKTNNNKDLTFKDFKKKCKGKKLKIIIRSFDSGSYS